MFHKEYLDLALVPAGLIILFSYHLFLLYRILTVPHTTVIGYENHNKMAWVERMMQDPPSNTGLALQVLSGNVSASTYLASLSITLSSLIGTWVGSSSSKLISDSVIFGDTSQATSSIKYITLLSFFLVAFTAFVQSMRYFLHASFLMSTLDSDIPLNYVQTAVIRGSNFWSLGLRALYFATSLLLWVFGPIPMFICSVVMVVALHFLDRNSTPLHKFQFHYRRGRERSFDGQQCSRNNVHLDQTLWLLPPRTI
ncbi:hypothetical protein H6P81_013891 [Aristolochia fimbriata]|uniref:CSC1/OSCA1-like 7TM region domain-containing protein n=1 Tax=Aristolochia fimbriata TaxID=158543 RepID=A0AAV7EG70_ARIFI|nr:hypothetical protein H6P81_013891 [Aristolochia fimbriata]